MSIKYISAVNIERFCNSGRLPNGLKPAGVQGEASQNDPQGITQPFKIYDIFPVDISSGNIVTFEVIAFNRILKKAVHLGKMKCSKKSFERLPSRILVESDGVFHGY